MKYIEETLSADLWFKHFEDVMKIYRAQDRLAFLRGRLNRKVYPLNYSALPKRLVARYKKVLKILADVEKTSIREFVDSMGSKESLNTFIIPYESIAEAYHEFVRDKDIAGLHKRQQIYSILVLCTMGIKELLPLQCYEPKDFGYKKLTKSEVFEIERYYRRALRRRKK